MHQLLITKPNVYLIGKLELAKPSLDKFLKDHGMTWNKMDNVSDGELLSESGGRVCYLSFDKGRKSNAEYLNHILEVEHESVLEHTVFTFIVSEVSRTFSHEFVRHRIGMSPSQLSQRYVDSSKSRLVIPPFLSDSSEAEEVMLRIKEQSLENYQKLYDLSIKKLEAQSYQALSSTTKRKIANNAARYALPESTETIIQFTINARALRHLIKLRAAPGAALEIRRVAVEMFKIASLETPNLFQDMKLTTNKEDGTEIVIFE